MSGYACHSRAETHDVQEAMHKLSSMQQQVLSMLERYSRAEVHHFNTCTYSAVMASNACSP